jgi:phosphopantothenoylcysteine decarboxylase/phosphopantothenate--cysteine ligase
MSPLIFETFSRNPVITDMFTGPKIETRHVDLATSADLILVSPATANIMPKLPTALRRFPQYRDPGWGNKTVFALRMNAGMYLNPITQENIAKLRQLGYGIIEPEEGSWLVRRPVADALADERIILAEVDRRLNGHGWLKGRK